MPASKLVKEYFFTNSTLFSLNKVSILKSCITSMGGLNFNNLNSKSFNESDTKENS